MATKTYTIKGDWMIDGYMDNLGRDRRLTVEVENGKLYDVDDFGMRLPCKITIDGEIRAWGASVGFLPDLGELDRIGISAH